MDSHVMRHRGSANALQASVKNRPALRLIASQATPVRRWLAPVSLLAAALWHGIKAVW
jgi:hypothetical protein